MQVTHQKKLLRCNESFYTEKQKLKQNQINDFRVTPFYPQDYNFDFHPQYSANWFNWIFSFLQKKVKKKLKEKLIYFILIYFVIQDAHKICKFLFCQNLNSSSEITLLAIVSTPWITSICPWRSWVGTVTSIWYQKFREFTVV